MQNGPSDDDFRQHLLVDPIYKSFGAKRTQMLLEALEFAKNRRFAEEVIIKSPLTVEHVLPQGANGRDWPIEIRDGETELDAFARRATLTQNIGNLTLLTQPFNSSLSNGPYKNKRREITKQSALALNTYFQDAPTWREVEIVRRAKKLAASALKVWPGPTR